MKKEPDFVHPVLDKKYTVVVNLRAVPPVLHKRLRMTALQRGVTLEQHILDILEAAEIQIGGGE